MLYVDREAYAMNRFFLLSLAHRILGYAASKLPIRASAILNFHSVSDVGPRTLNWRRTLTVSPKFIEHLLAELRSQDIAIVSLADALDRACNGDKRAFVAFTFDDGYADNFREAFPIFQRYGAPFAIFLTTGFIDRTIPMWWSILEFIILNNNYLVLPDRSIMARSWAEKNSALSVGLEAFRNFHPDEMEYRIDNLLTHYPGTQAREFALERPLDWDMVRLMAQSRLVTFGAHTIRHPKLNNLDPQTALKEITGSRDQITLELGSPPRFFAYPYGGAVDINGQVVSTVAKSGFKAAFTTERKMVSSVTHNDLFAIPRIAINGHYQHCHALDAYFLLAERHGHVRHY